MARQSHVIIVLLTSPTSTCWKHFTYQMSAIKATHVLNSSTKDVVVSNWDDSNR